MIHHIAAARAFLALLVVDGKGFGRLVDLFGRAGKAEAFAVYYKKGEESSGSGYLMDHSRAAYLMGRKGEPIATLPVDQSAEAVAAELAKWVS